MHAASRRTIDSAILILLMCPSPLTAEPSEEPARAMPTATPRPTPPVARKIPVDVSMHGEKRVDDYQWMRERDNPAVRKHLEAENAYVDALTAHLAPLRERLYREMLGRIQETDMSVPVPRGGWLYYTRTEQGKPYRAHFRKKAPDGPEELLLDENKLAEGHAYFSLGVLEVSPDHKLLAYATDTTGRERYTLRFLDLETGRPLPHSVEAIASEGEWASDNRTFFYLTPDDTERPCRLWRHVIDEAAEADQLIHEEKDERVYLGLGKTRSERFIVLTLNSMVTGESRLIDADRPHEPMFTVVPRRQGIEYSVTHHGETIYMTTNDQAQNFRLLAAPVDAVRAANGAGGVAWEEVIPHRSDVLLQSVEAFRHFLVFRERTNGLPTLRIRSLVGGEEHAIDFPEPSYAVSPRDNDEFDTSRLRFTYASPIMPSSVFDYDMKTRQRTLLKEHPVLGGYDRARYIVERLYARARDGQRVPLTLLRLKELPRDGANPTLLYGYGSYGASMDAWFDQRIFSLVDRGFVYAVANIRGGSELGRHWYDDGRMMKKMNTFYDFINAAEHLMAENYTSPEHLAIEGGSAGGLLVGACAMLRPDLFKVVVAAVPFVDVINTMVDPSIPLTATEWEQWGDPRKPEDYQYIRQYSPYDNVTRRAYPNIIATTGFNDPRVAYWEPAKWVARLREHNIADTQIVLKTELVGGHGGPTGRYEGLKHEAYLAAFMLDRLGLAEREPLAGTSSANLGK